MHMQNVKVCESSRVLSAKERRVYDLNKHNQKSTVRKALYYYSFVQGFFYSFPCHAVSYLYIISTRYILTNQRRKNNVRI
jgi:hypothetical protein